MLLARLAVAAMAILALQAAHSAAAQTVRLDNVDGRVEIDFSRPVRAAQCRFSDGEKAILFRRSDRDFLLLLTRVRVDAPDTPATFQILPSGEESLEAQGGVASYAAYGSMFDEVRRMPMRRIRRQELNAFRRATRVPRCRRSTFTAYYPW